MGLAFERRRDRCSRSTQGRVVAAINIPFVTGTRLKREGRLRGDALVATI
jgi:hypothetical protein